MPTIDHWRALREALEAGPTDGKRFIQDASPWTDAEGKFVQFEAFNISAGSADRSSEDYYRIASVSNINDAPCNKANAMLFAAADPTTIRALLDERDRLAAEVEALRADAERYRWLRDSRRIPRNADPELHIVVCAAGGEDVLWSASMDASIDAARGIKEGGAV